MKVVVIGVGGVTWQDLLDADMPALDRLIEKGAAANLSVRLSNWPGEAYAALSAGQRAIADPSSGWAFNADEVVEHGPASDLFRRRSGEDPSGEVLVVSVEELRRANENRGLGAAAGLLGERLAAAGRRTAVVGNADFTRLPLPQVLPSATRGSLWSSPDAGIHREAALAAMRRDGTVPLGEVGRRLLRDDPAAPFGITTSASALMEAFRRVAASSDFIVVETGDTARADAYSLRLPAERRRSIRLEALGRADRQIEALVGAVDSSKTLLVVLAPTTPGGANQRGQLRPVVLKGPGLPHGLLTSGSTRRRGLISVPDLTVT
ncbi:MAG: hypothetical protein ACRD0D_14700, partial [Acidimicrobiales bacterium]